MLHFSIRRRSLAPVLSLLLAISLALFSSLVSALPSATGNRVLVVIEPSVKSTYSTFLASLSSRGYSVEFKAPRDVKPQLVQHDVLSYDHLILLSPAAKSLAADISPQQLVEYLKTGGNMLVGLDSTASEMHRDFAREFSLEFEERGSALVDHFRYSDQDAGNHTSVLVGGKKSATARLSTGGLVPNTNVFSTETLRAAKDAPLLYRGIAHRVGANPLAFPLILPPATSYSSDVPALVKEQDDVVESTSYSTPAPVTVTTTRIVDGEAFTSEILSTPRAVPTVVKSKAASKLGKNGWVAKNRASLESLESRKELVAGLPTSASTQVVSLVSGFQLASNSARAVFLGSTDLLSDAFFSDSLCGKVNELVVSDLTSWAFQEKGVLKVVATHHHRVKSSPSDTREDYEETEEGSRMYRIKDHVQFSVDLVQHHPQLGFIPADKSLDLQVAFKMLDPYITAHLAPVDSGNFTHISPATVGAGQGESQAFQRFETTFQVPDRHGVFTFHLDFKRQGLSFVESKDTAPVRPFNHDEYPRFLSSSWPYITGAFSTVAGFLVFVAIWLTIRDEPSTGKKNN
ncbi:Dolichyl-diphosphooligosaccharide--protein glycosyltransferase subunit WBP1 [Kalmanozyma brasiliensis GHG001]|uniref:Dolichyl-diphosphooligosaccharide--protein glycosyltransferase subunit WBP1 n=1 Tax=Kalmanozyma brasiliensis (strain GHG001) TaxID=1365824 RepID=V5EF56_KALBG|nr:Dolichyl-diphosphooligosaccharide--protein glycosyltransferase subunit WBP1 [Kalmanozyma brasiliensis GHG001]EST09106.1 Dolichyl-diphosphooligosaccharide--protein glycosyltransferase subunit WBP1 [Kalmanozyma brasiliensis GHG001]